MGRTCFVVFLAFAFLGCSDAPSGDGGDPIGADGVSDGGGDGGAADGGDAVHPDAGPVDGAPDADKGPCEGQDDGAPCDDGNQCTAEDTCESGICVGAVNVVCESDDPCQVAACDPASGCNTTVEPDGTPCAVPCFEAATCQAGACEPAAETAYLCPAPDADQPCVAELQCEASTGACTREILFPEGSACNADSDVCTYETCSAEGACETTGEIDQCTTQQQNNPCWTWVCNKKTGCIQTLFVEGAPCDDNAPCTMNDTCLVTDIGQKACLGEPVDVDDGNPCTDDSCDEEGVSHEPIDGIACDPDDGCTTQGMCVAGACEAADTCECLVDVDCPPPVDLCAGTSICDVSGPQPKCVTEPGTEVVCLPSPQDCVTYECVPATGMCVPATAPEGTPCDENPCVTGQTCLFGLCQGGSVTDCDDEDPCTADSCGALGCEHVNDDGASCDPDDACSPTGTCAQGSCVPDDGCSCTVDGDCPTFEDLCIGTSLCDTSASPPACVLDPATAVVCTPSDQACVTNACDPDTGLCVESPDGEGEACDDGDPCTDGDACLSGDCVGAWIPGCGGPVDCDNPGSGACVVAQANQDTWLESGATHGSDPLLIVGKHGGFPKKRSLVQFDLGDIPDGATVMSATFELYYVYAHKASFIPEDCIDRVIRVHQMLKPWTEAVASQVAAAPGVDWDTWLVGIDDVEAAIVPEDEQLWPWQDTGWKSFDITQLAQAWATDPASNFGVLLMTPSEDTDGCDMRIRSRNAPEVDQHPVLEIVFQP